VGATREEAGGELPSDLGLDAPGEVLEKRNRYCVPKTPICLDNPMDSGRKAFFIFLRRKV